MSAFDFLSWHKIVGGGADARAGSLTGDLSQRLTGIKDRILGTTSPGLSASSSGSLGQQVQYLVDNPAPGSILAGLGLGKVFPFTNGTTTDLTINGADQTVAPTNGVLRYRTITFSTAHTLRITKSRCILMVDTLTWNAAGLIACEASGAPSIGADPSEDFPRGGRATNTGEAIGGYGGGFLIVLAGTVNGSTTGTIRASGTAGSRNTTNAGDLRGRGGEGAMDSTWLYSGNGPTTLATVGFQALSVGANLNTAGTLHNNPEAFALGFGGYTTGGGTRHGMGGGSGAGQGALCQAAGGSGFGGGGAVDSAAAPNAGGAPFNASPDLMTILELWRKYCRGGAGGGAGVHTTGTNNAAGGGGGGCVVLIVDNETQVSTLTAAGGAAAGTNGSAGGAGVTLRQVI